VRRFARATSIDELLAKTTSRITLLDTFEPHLNQRFNDCHTDAASLYSEIREQGYRDSPQTVRRYLHPFRANRTAPAAAPAVPKINGDIHMALDKCQTRSRDDRCPGRLMTYRNAQQ
jgi:hypothetical protein